VIEFQKGAGNIMLSNRPKYTRPETLDFLQTHINELRGMAGANKLDLVEYLLGMAYVELGDIVRQERPFAQPDRKSVQTSRIR
jgi:hypothetical protein